MMREVAHAEPPSIFTMRFAFAMFSASIRAETRRSTLCKKFFVQRFEIRDDAVLTLDPKPRSRRDDCNSLGRPGSK